MKFNELFRKHPHTERIIYTVKDDDKKTELNNINKEIVSKYNLNIANRNAIIRSLIQFLSQGEIFINNELKFTKQPLHIIKADIANFFPSINKHYLYKKIIKSSILNNYSIEVIKSFIFTSKIKGIPLGLPFSNSLAELYLEQFDRNIQIKLRPMFFVRYVDDILIISHISNIHSNNIEDEITPQLNYIKENLAKLNLKLNDQKTKKISHNSTESFEFDFLGYNFQQENGQLIVDISQKKFKQKILNRTIRSFKHYLSSGHAETDYWILYYRLKHVIYGVTTTGENNVLKFGIGYSYKFINTDITLKSFLKTFYYFIHKIRPHITKTKLHRLLSLITVQDDTENSIVLHCQSSKHDILKLLKKRVNYTKMSVRTLEKIFTQIDCPRINSGDGTFYSRNLQVQIFKKLRLK